MAIWYHWQRATESKDSTYAYAKFTPTIPTVSYSDDEYATYLHVSHSRPAVVHLERPKVSTPPLPSDSRVCSDIVTVGRQVGEGRDGRAVPVVRALRAAVAGGAGPLPRRLPQHQEQRPRRPAGTEMILTDFRELWEKMYIDAGSGFLRCYVSTALEQGGGGTVSAG